LGYHQWLFSPISKNRKKNADLFVSCPGAPDEMKEMIDSRRTYEAHWLSLQKQA
jgi:predicted Mrr-cat superfamily restriction endonuclease